MTTFVLVHGAYHGGWCWRWVSARLEAQGHEVFAPSLTGLGERAHLSSPDVDLDTHIADIVNLLDWWELEDVVLVGHSYAGMVIAGAADQRPDRFGALVFVDAVIPEDGKSVIDMQSPGRAELLAQSVADNDGWRLPKMSAELYGVEDADKAAWVNAKCVDQPWATFTQPLSLSGDWLSVPRKLYIRCTETPLDYMDAFAERAAGDDNWDLMQLETGHDCMVTEPERQAAMLMTLG